MVHTKLILLEGPPGSGKSTTAQLLADEISRSGKTCQCFLEWSTDNPIVVGDDLHLGHAIASSLAREADTLKQWRQFAQTRQTQEIVTVMESRFWQTGVMLMYAAGHSRDNVLETNRRVVEAIQGLEPMLICFAIDDLKAFTTQIIQIKEAEWQRGGQEGSWAQHIYDALEPQEWFTDRGLTGLEGLLAFYNEWALITQELYLRAPFRKIQIRNPHHDWGLAMKQMRGFLGLS